MKIHISCEVSIISILYFIHSVQDDLPQVFIEAIGFTVDSILKNIISRHCCGLGFYVKCLVKLTAKESKF